jgi:hypothetical protein
MHLSRLVIRVVEAFSAEKCLTKEFFIQEEMATSPVTFEASWLLVSLQMVCIRDH